MIEVFTNKNNNSVNIADDVYIIEKESYYKIRESSQLYVCGEINETELDAQGYHYYYEAILKSVNRQNIIIYRYYMADVDNFSDNDLELKDCIEAFYNSDMVDFFYQSENTAIIFDREDFSYADVRVWWNELPNNYDINEFMYDQMCTWDDESWIEIHS